MTDFSGIGLDLDKGVFQVHGVNAHEQVTVRRALRRTQLFDWFSKLPPSLIGIEACGTAHYWARELSALGNTVRLMPPSYVKAYVRRNKNDAAGAAAICEAVSRPSMRFVELEGAGQQAAASQHRVRQMLIKQQTAAMNSLRGLIAEFGIVAAKGAGGFGELLAIVADPADGRIPDLLRTTLACIAATLDTLKRQLEKVDKAMAEWGRSDTISRHLSTIPGVGVVTATAASARVTNPRGFDSGRHFAAPLSIVPCQDGTGSKVKLGPISKRGDGYLRRMLVKGALAVLRSKQGRQDPWLAKLLDSKPLMLAAVALANKNARIIRALMIRQEDFRAPRPAAA